jgi:hypothetical protein
VIVSRESVARKDLNTNRECRIPARASRHEPRIDAARATPTSAIDPSGTTPGTTPTMRTPASLVDDRPRAISLVAPD